MTDQAKLDDDVRLHIYEDFLSRSLPPSVAESARALGLAEEEVAAAYERLAASRTIVLQGATHDILMANPLSAVPTRFRVWLDDGRAYFANCVWDALGVAAMLGTSATVETSCPDCDEPLRLAVRDGTLERSEGVVHFAVPAARWWEDIVFT